MELEELDTNLVELEEYRCRTCLFSSEKTMCFTQVNQLCYPSKTVKDILVQMIPQMEATVSEDDRICRTCLKTVISFARFIDKCLEIENQLLQDNEELVKNLTQGTDQEDSTENSELGNAQVVENIEIVVENDLEKSFDHDHLYIKTECDDSTNQYIEPIELQAASPTDEDTDMADPEMPYEEYDANMIAEIIDEDGNLVETEDGVLLVSDITDKYLKGEIEGVEPETLLIKEELQDEDSGNIYQCSKCNKLFKNKSGLKAHFKLLHLNLEPFKCHLCHETFARADYLKKHLMTHASEKEKKGGSKNIPGKFIRFKNTASISDEPIPCKICGKFYNGINKLKVHLQTHVVVKRYQCEFCNLTYKRWPSLKRHEKTHLESDENFHRCNVCWKRLKTEEELKLHMASHGNPKYQCHICEEQFHRKYLFDNHYLLEHATPEDLENSRKEIIYDTLLELSNRID